MNRNQRVYRTDVPPRSIKNFTKLQRRIYYRRKWRDKIANLKNYLTISLKMFTIAFTITAMTFYFANIPATHSYFTDRSSTGSITFEAQWDAEIEADIIFKEKKDESDANSMALASSDDENENDGSILVTKIVLPSEFKAKDVDKETIKMSKDGDSQTPSDIDIKDDNLLIAEFDWDIVSDWLSEQEDKAIVISGEGTGFNFETETIVDINKPEPDQEQESIELEGKTELTIPVDDEEINEDYQATVEDDNGETLSDKSVKWELAESKEGVTLQEDGTLIVENKASAGQITLVATTSDDSDISEEITVELKEPEETEEVKPHSIEITGQKETTISDKDMTKRLNATVKDEDGEEIEDESIIWELKETDADGVDIDEEIGELTISEDASPGSITVLAVSETDSDLTEEFELEVRKEDEEQEDENKEDKDKDEDKEDEKDTEDETEDEDESEEDEAEEADDDNDEDKDSNEDSDDKQDESKEDTDDKDGDDEESEEPEEEGNEDSEEDSDDEDEEAEDSEGSEESDEDSETEDDSKEEDPDEIDENNGTDEFEEDEDTEEEKSEDEEDEGSKSEDTDESEEENDK